MKNIILFVSLLLISCDKEQINEEMDSKDTLLNTKDFRELNDDNLDFISSVIPEDKVAVILLKPSVNSRNYMNRFKVRRNMLRRLKNQNSGKIDFVHIVPLEGARKVRSHLNILWAYWLNRRFVVNYVPGPVMFFLIGDQLAYEIINEERTCLDDLQTIIDSIDYL